MNAAAHTTPAFGFRADMRLRMRAPKILGTGALVRVQNARVTLAERWSG